MLLVIQYARPQDIFPPLEAFRPYALTAFALIGFMILTRSNILQFQHKQIRWMWIYWGFFILYLPFTHNKSVALSHLNIVLMLMPFVLSTVILVDNVKRLRIVVDVIVIMSIVIAIRGFMLHDGFYKGAMFNLGNFLGDPNDYSLFMNMMLPLSYFMFMYEKNRMWKKTIYGVAATLALVSVIISFSRGGFLGLMCTGFIMWLYSPRRLVTATVGVFAIIVALMFVGAEWKETMGTSVDTSQSTAQTRITAWTASLKTFLHNPMGVGMYNTTSTMWEHVPTDRNPMRYYGDVSHSLWLTALVEGGIVGFSIFLYLIYLNIKDTLSMRRLKELDDDLRFLKYFGVATFTMLIAYLVSGTFITVNYYPHFWYLTAIIAAGSRIVFTIHKDHITEHATAEKMFMAELRGKTQHATST